MTAPAESDLDQLFDPFTTSGQEAMDQVLAAARERLPVFFSSRLQAWVVTRADDVTRALEDPATFSSLGVLGNPPRKEIQEVLGGRVPEGATLIGWDEPQHRLANSALLLHSAVADLIEARRADPADDLISRVLAAEAEEPVALPAQELLSLFPGLIFAGHETTAQLIVLALARLLGRPDRHELVDDDDELARFVEETARLDSPVAGMARTVTRPVRLRDVDLEPGDRVFLHFGSANRDGAAVEEPERFALDRRVPTAHLAFGRGIHACVGAALGRVEARSVLRALVRKWPDAGLDGRPDLQPHYFIRGFSSLRIRR